MQPPVQRFDPEFLKEQAKRHWQEFLPKKYAALKASGQLDQSLDAAVNLTLQAMQDDREAGYSQYEAWEKDRSQYLLCPPEFGLNSEKHPPSLAYEAVSEKNKAFREAGPSDLPVR